MVTIANTPVTPQPFGIKPIGQRGRSKTAVMKKRKVSFYEGPRAAGPATSVLSSSVGPFPSSALKKSPAGVTDCDIESFSPRSIQSNTTITNTNNDFPAIASSPVSDRKCGMLMKHAIGRSKIFKLRNWKQRWVVANQNGLSYHKTESNDGESSCVLKIPFTADTYLISTPNKKSHTFINTSNGDIYFGISFIADKKRYSLIFQASSELEKGEWLQFLVQKTTINCELRGETPSREEALGSDSGSSESSGTYYGDLPFRRVHTSPASITRRHSAGPTKYRIVAQQLSALTKPAMSSPAVLYHDPSSPIETPLGRRNGSQPFCD